MSENKNPAAPAAPATPAAPAEPTTRARKPQDLEAKVAQHTKPKEEPRQVTIKTRNRHAVAFRHDIFVSDAKDCLKNTSYKLLQPELHPVPHKHIFHSHTNNGKPMNRTGSAAGHFHYVEQWVDADGNIRAKCGPAMHEVQIAAENGMVFNRIVPVTFDKIVMSGENAGQKLAIADDHTHQLEYIGSENLNPAQIKEELERQQALAATMGISLGKGSVQDMTPPPMSPADGASIKG